MADFRLVSINDIVQFDNIRKEAYGFSNSTSTFYIEKLLKNEMLGIGAYINNKLIGGACISSYFDSLYIENIFVKEEYRNNKIASNLINYIIMNKKVFEEYFSKEFITSKLEPNSSNVIGMYEKLGYGKPNSMNIMTRRI